jgi:predicted nucleic acid-binding Zn ribbon protein
LAVRVIELLARVVFNAIDQASQEYVIEQERLQRKRRRKRRIIVMVLLVISMVVAGIILFNILR